MKVSTLKVTVTLSHRKTVGANNTRSKMNQEGGRQTVMVVCNSQFGL